MDDPGKPSCIAAFETKKRFEHSHFITDVTAYRIDEISTAVNSVNDMARRF